MATSFGGEGGSVDIKRVLTNPWVLGGGLLLLVIAVIAWRRTSGNQATNVSGQVASPLGIQPGSSPAAATTDQLGLETSGLQQQLSNLTQQVSAGFAGVGTLPAGGSGPLQFQVIPKAYGIAPNQSAVPVYSAPSGTASVEEWLPLSAKFQASGAPVSGQNISIQGVSSSFYEPIALGGGATGYLSANDVNPVGQ